MIRKLALCAVVLCLGATGALADTFGRGYVRPPDWERTYQEHLRVFPADKDPLPAVWDWRTMDGVTPAKNQGSCGSCWAFAAAGEMEAKIRIYYGNRILDLSEQQIVSCNPYGADCSGGWAGSAYYVFQHRGGITEDCMPYEAVDGVPCVDTQYLEFADITGWYTVSPQVDQIKQALLEGPVCATIDANAAFEGYSGGCLDAPGGWTNHLILIVGWDDRACDGNEGAWIIKNSWGPGWGEAGFGYVKWDACSIATDVTALYYTPPPVDIRVTGPTASQALYGEGPVNVTWNTFGQATDTVDIWFGEQGYRNNVLVADNVPNTGAYTWTLPNLTADRASFVVSPGSGTPQGFGFTLDPLTILGQQTRYVSSTGSNTPPYDTPAKAARTIGAAVLAGAGRDTVKVAAGEYLETIAVNSPCVIAGGYNNGFTMHDPAAYPTRLRGVTGALRFSAAAGSHCGVVNVTFHDCVAAIGSVPVAGYNGAAILSTGASPTIENCVFTDNRANPTAGVGWGGALLLHGGSPVVRDCTFVGNVGSHGGAIALSQSAGGVIEDCTFDANACSESIGRLPRRRGLRRRRQRRAARLRLHGQRWRGHRRCARHRGGRPGVARRLRSRRQPRQRGRRRHPRPVRRADGDGRRLARQRRDHRPRRRRLGGSGHSLAAQRPPVRQLRREPRRRRDGDGRERRLDRALRVPCQHGCAGRRLAGVAGRSVRRAPQRGAGQRRRRNDGLRPDRRQRLQRLLAEHPF